MLDHIAKLAYDLFITADQTSENLLHNSNWKEQRASLNTDEFIDYIGRNTKHGAFTSDKTWYIWKYYYDEDDFIYRVEGPLIGAWDDRESLPWV